MSKTVEGPGGELLELDDSSAEPILTRALLAPLVAEAIALAISFGVDLTKEQALSLQGVVVSVALIVGAWLARKKVFSGRTTAAVLDRQLDQVTRPGTEQR